MSVDLSGYRAIGIANFIELDIPNYQTLRFSDFIEPITIDGELYSNIGSLLTVSDTGSEIKVLEKEINFSISGIPVGSIAEIMNNNPKGGTVTVRQAYFDPNTNALLNIAGNPIIKFKGLITNYIINEQWRTESREASAEITFTANSLITTLLNKINGRRTNDSDNKALHPGDLSMSRVVTITNARYQFGKAK